MRSFKESFACHTLIKILYSNMGASTLNHDLSAFVYVLLVFHCPCHSGLVRLVEAESPKEVEFETISEHASASRLSYPTAYFTCPSLVRTRRDQMERLIRLRGYEDLGT